mgnify:FL=1
MHRRKFIIGAYVTAPTLFEWDPVLADRYWERILGLCGIAGLEHDYWGSLHKFDNEWFLNMVAKDWDFVFTCIPGTMVRLQTTPTFGLASPDPSGQRAALEYTARARDAICTLNDRLGRKAVTHVQLHSAPSWTPNLRGTEAAFRNSLGILAGWDWDGARLCIEHCDAPNPPRPAEKGFLSLREEISAVRSINIEQGTNIGITINWGRSAIEGRNAMTAEEHIGLVKDAGLLSGLMFSGCSDSPGPYGEWKDTHMPPPAADMPYGENGSLMDAASIKRCLNLAGTDLDYIGLKLMMLPQTDDLDRRVGINSQCISLLNCILEGGRHAPVRNE